MTIPHSPRAPAPALPTAAVWTVRVTAGLLSTVGLLGVVAGFAMVVTDQLSHAEEMDGLGVALGVVLAALGAGLLGVGVLAVVLARRDVRAGGVVLLVAGLLAAALGLTTGAAFGTLAGSPLALAGFVVGVAGAVPFAPCPAG